MHYYENVVEDGGDDTRKATIQEMAKKLRKVLACIENELQSGARLCSATCDSHRLQVSMPLSRSSETRRRTSSTSPSCNSTGCVLHSIPGLRWFAQYVYSTI